MFIQVVLMDVAQGKFPNQFALQSLFELILVSNSHHKHETFSAEDHWFIIIDFFCNQGINETPNEEYAVENVIDMSAFTINSIMEAFPPCWLPANRQYRTLLMSKNQNIISKSGEFLAEHKRSLFELT